MFVVLTFEQVMLKTAPAGIAVVTFMFTRLPYALALEEDVYAADELVKSLTMQLGVNSPHATP